MRYFVGSVLASKKKEVVMQTDSKKDYTFSVTDGKRYAQNKKYKVFTYKEAKLDEKNQCLPEHYAFLDKHEYLLFLFLIETEGVDASTAMKLLENDFNLLIKLILEKDVLAISKLINSNLKIANSLVKIGTRKKYQNKLEIIKKEINKKFVPKSELKEN